MIVRHLHKALAVFAVSGRAQIALGPTHAIVLGVNHRKAVQIRTYNDTVAAAHLILRNCLAKQAATDVHLRFLVQREPGFACVVTVASFCAKYAA